MYEYGLDTDQDADAMNRTLATIDSITDDGYRKWITTAPAADSEIARLERAVPTDPVDLSHSLSFAAIASLDALQMIAMIVRSNVPILTPLRSMMRTALMGVGRIGYVVLPKDGGERETNAGTLLALEVASYKRALKHFETFEHLAELVPDADDTGLLREQFGLHPSGRLDGDGKMIQAAVRLIGREIAADEPGTPVGMHEEQFTLIWNTASGAAHGFHWQNDFPGIFTADIGAVTSGVQYTLEKMRCLWTRADHTSEDT